MSWLFSQALEAEFSAATCSDGAPSAPLSVMPTPHKFWRNDKTMEPSRLSRFGLTCAVLTEDHGEALLTWFLADSRVRTYRPQGGAPESKGNAPGSGAKWHESSVRYDHLSSSWKTHQCLWEEALPWSSVTLPKWGMTRDGVLWEPQTLALITSETESGLWPTPTASLGTKGGRVTPRKSRHGGTLIEAVSARMWPTPKANDAEKRGNFDVNNPRNGLPAAAKRWPTPVASMAKGSSPAALTRKSGADRSSDRLDHAVMASDGGQLNPTWVEWLMGWPTEWTALKPLAMARFREWQQQHSPCLPKTGSDAA